MSLLYGENSYWTKNILRLESHWGGLRVLLKILELKKSVAKWSYALKVTDDILDAIKIIRDKKHP